MASRLSDIKRVAIIHDWLTGMRGGERVLEELLKLFPQADIFTLVYDRDRVSPLISSHQVFESSLVKLPFARSHFRSWLPLFPWAIESFELKGYQLVLSSSHCVAKGAIPPPDALHVSYVHSPMRYVWDMRGEYLSGTDTTEFRRGIAGFAAHYLRNWDASSSTRVDRFIANSGHVRNRIIKYYRRDAEVIHPPVEVDNFKPGEGKGGYFLTVSALVPYKRIDLAISACESLGRPLKIIGDGPEHSRLRSFAGKNTEFLGSIDFKDLQGIYADALAFIHPAEEDFGIAPLEAQAAGRPVIAYGRGGALETVVASGEAPTGVFFHQPTVESLSNVIKDFNPALFRPTDARANAEKFAPAHFREKISYSISEAWRRQSEGEALR